MHLETNSNIRLIFRCPAEPRASLVTTFHLLQHVISNSFMFLLGSMGLVGVPWRSLGILRVPYGAFGFFGIPCGFGFPRDP